ncbi:ankyrin repeat domain-containing protein 31-like [Odontomachus brunneus]|uniref:ankyrin repeat domain-containing protein 31-like n=1 Tax=Odontomachus brunneus TaxID=486640 RepID=UPI0013F288AF|nr:ankyrin repeat domain-containing protein 31-like [Odontomachus brunneus]
MLSTPKAKGGLFLASSLCDGLEDNNIRQVATLLLNKDADPNVLIPTHGVTPFHLVIGNDSVGFAEEVTKLFLRHGGDPNVRSNDGMTPVHVAAAWGRLNILELLLANGGDPLCLDSDGRSPFHYAFDGKYFKAVTMLAKYCENTQDDNDEPKYNMMLDKVLLTNGDIIAEYVASHNVVLDLNTNNAPKNNTGFYSCKPNSSLTNLTLNNTSKMNVSKLETESVSNTDMEEYEEDTNIKSADLSNNEIFVEGSNFSQTDSKDMLNYSFVDLDFDFASLHLSDVMQKEKCLVSKIISHLSTTLTSDCTINETLQNYKKNKHESVTNSSDMFSSPPLKEKIKAFREYRKTPKNFSSKLKHNRNKDILKPSTPTVKKQCSKFSTGSTSRKKYKKTSDKILLTPPYILDNSIISMSPNFNTPNYRKRINATKTPLILSHVHNDDIVSRSPNFLTPARAGEKRNIDKTSLVSGCLSPKMLKKSHEYKTQTQHSEFNRCKRYIAQSTPRRKKRSIYKLHSSRKRPDCYRQEDDVTADECMIRNTLKPINLGKTIFLEEAEHAIHHDILNSNSNFGSLLLNSNETVELGRQNYMAIRLNDNKYDEDDTAHYNSDSSQMDLDNSFNQMGKKDESFDSSDNDKNDCMKHKNHQLNAPFVTIRKNSFKIGKATGNPTNSAINNIGSTYTISSLYGENYVDCVDCDTKKLLNEDIHMNISKTCNLHAKSWCSNRLHEPFPHKSEPENDSHISIVNLPAKCEIYLPNCPRLYSLKLNIDSKGAEDTLETGNSSIHKIERSSSLLSYITTQEYKYEDLEEGVVLLERRLCVSSFATLSGSECNIKNGMSGASSMSTIQSLPKELLIDDIALRRELAQLGDSPGPITDTTRNVYKKRLMHLRSINALPRLSVPRNISRNYAEQYHRVIKSHLEFGDWVNHLDTYRSLERQVFQEFVSPNPSRRWREGRSQTSFNYLLLDPRVTQDLQHRKIYLTEAEVWSIFLNAIFYIGKGKRSRPFAHLYDAFKIWVSKTSLSVNRKINCILDIWNNDHGVICLHVFQNVIPVEAYTREAAMIDAIGTECLGNCKGGEYYGIAATWSLQQKQKFGRYLLYRALQILLHEGERQLFPQNL